jgi:hypothetical protein
VLLFGLVLRGRFDEEAGDTDGLASHSQRPTRMSLLTLAVGAGAVGLMLTLIFDGGAILGLGIVGLFAFVGLASIAIVSDATSSSEE